MKRYVSYPTLIKWSAPPQQGFIYKDCDYVVAKNGRTGESTTSCFHGMQKCEEA